VCRRPAWLSGAVEGPYMIYNSETQYYYLFVSYGSLKSDYCIRVGRSRNILGPFVDVNGNCLTDDPDLSSDPGYLLLAGFEWNRGNAYMGPGHNSVLQDADGRDYIVYHIRDKHFNEDPGPSQMQIRQIFWNEEGWPVASGFTVEEAKGKLTQIDGELTMEKVAGVYERINFKVTYPQGISGAVPMLLRADGYYESGSIQGTWKTENGRILINYGPFNEKALAYEGADCLGISGMCADGTQFVARRERKL